MTQFFARKLNKKGFTLAELLIVIAIIAILVAIALPIFANYLDGARVSVHESNARAIKAMAIKELLSPSQDTLNKYGPEATETTNKGLLAKLLKKVNDHETVWATGTVDTKGNITLTGLVETSSIYNITHGLGSVMDAKGDYVDVSEAGDIDVHQDLSYAVAINSTTVTYT